MRPDPNPVVAARNLFEVDNARYLSVDEVVTTFVPTKSFWRLISAKNHIVLGARGSGKTAMLRMLAHDHLSRFDDARAKRAIRSKAFIGMYLPVKADWVGGLKNKSWLNDDEQESLFQWRLNVASCVALIATLSSCISAYFSDDISRLRAEAKISTDLARLWLNRSTERRTLSEVATWLADLDFEKQLLMARRRTKQGIDEDSVVGLVFHTELFEPIKQAIRIVGPVLGTSDQTMWMMCLDEAEALEPFHHRILNSYLRTNSGNLVFKMSTTPYGHYTLETNVGAGLSVGNDFEYVYIDNDMAVGSDTHHTRESKIFVKRAKRSGARLQRVTLNSLLGDSVLLEPKEITEEISNDLDRYLEVEGSAKLSSRARGLRSAPEKYRNEVARKVHGAVLLRRAVAELRGQQDVDLYSGTAMILKCSDGNPRRLIRLFNKLISEGDWASSVKGSKPAIKPISAQKQSYILRSFSISVLARVQGEPDFGPPLYRALATIGRNLKADFHERPMSTDWTSSVSIDRATSPETLKLVRAAVGLGLLYPNVHQKTPDEMPESEGVFRFAYVLAPAFYLLPRRGKSRRIETLLRPDATVREIDLMPQLSFKL